MAKIVGQGRGRAPRREQRYLPAATAISEAAREILIDIYGETEWTDQVCEIVRGGVQRGIEQLGSSSLDRNAQPGESYRFPARTASELEATRDQAAQVDDGNRSDGRQDDGSVSWLL